MKNDEKPERFVFMADSHVKSRTWTNSTALEGDAYRALETLLTGIPQDVDTLVVGGDWFDGNRPSSSDVAASERFLSRFRSVWYVRGNHDCAEPPWMDSLSAGAKHLTVQPEQLSENAWICGIDWSSSADSLKASLIAVKDCIYGMLDSVPSAVFYVVLHTSIKELLGFEGSYRLSMAEVEELFSGLPVRLLVGDVHVRRTIPFSSGSYVHSPGSLYPLSTDQMALSHSASLVDACSGAISDIPVDVRKYFSCSWTSLDDLDVFVQSAVASSAGSVLPPYISVDMPDSDQAVVPAGRYSDAVVRVRRSSQSDPESFSSMQPPGVAMEDAVRAAAEYDPDIQDMALALLAADDPVVTVEGWLAFWGVIKGC